MGKKKKKKFEIEFDMVGDKKLPDYISWEEEEVMYELAKFFREKIKDGHFGISFRHPYNVIVSYREKFP